MPPILWINYYFDPSSAIKHGKIETSNSNILSKSQLKFYKENFTLWYILWPWYEEETNLYILAKADTTVSIAKKIH